MRLNLIWRFVLVAISCCFLLISIVFATGDKVTAQDSNFVAYDNGVVKDRNTVILNSKEVKDAHRCLQEA